MRCAYTVLYLYVSEFQKKCTHVLPRISYSYIILIARFSRLLNVLKSNFYRCKPLDVSTSLATVAIGKSNTGAFTTRQKRRQRDHSDPSGRRRMYVATQHRYASSIGGGNNPATGDRGRVCRYHRD